MRGRSFRNGICILLGAIHARRDREAEVGRALERKSVDIVGDQRGIHPLHHGLDAPADQARAQHVARDEVELLDVVAAPPRHQRLVSHEEVKAVGEVLVDVLAPAECSHEQRSRASEDCNQ